MLFGRRMMQNRWQHKVADQSKKSGDQQCGPNQQQLKCVSALKSLCTSVTAKPVTSEPENGICGCRFL
jgi:hypothetical protein